MHDILSTQTPAWPLAVARVGLGLSVLLAAVSGYGTLLAVADGRIPRPWAGWLPPVTGDRAILLLALLVVPAVALVLGLAARPAAAIAATGLMCMFAWEQQTYSNHVALCLMLCVWLALAPGATTAGLSRNSGPVLFGDQVLLMTQLSACYAFAGIAKVHPDFLSGDVLRSFIDVSLPGVVTQVLAYATVATELALALGLWLRRLRVATAALGVAFHISIPVAMGTDRYGLVAFSLTCLCLYPLFLTRPSTRPFGDRDPLEHGRVTTEPEL